MVQDKISENSLWKKFQSIKSGRWSLRILYFVIGIALLADFIANDKPVVCSINGNTHFPIFKSWIVKAGISGWSPVLLNADWKTLDYDFAIFPLIPYAPTTQDIYNRGCVGPFENQRVKGTKWHHWLGTDRLGRDVAAGMVHGTRIALLVGLVSMSIATIIGLFFGALAGYFGNDRFRVSPVSLLLTIILIAGYSWIIIFSREAQWLIAAEGGNLTGEILFRFGTLLGLAGLLFLFEKRLSRKILPTVRPLKIPVDTLTMRLIEVFRSLPGLLLLLAVLSLFDTSSIFYVMVIIGFLRWPSIAQFLRAELLKIRELEYIQAARVLGFSHGRIILKHAIPNALTPVFITIAFGIASSILLEAFISFLGIGLAPQDVTWGSLLNDARQNIAAWWLAVFPGMAIFITVTIFNLIGDALNRAMNE